MLVKNNKQFLGHEYAVFIVLILPAVVYQI